MSVKYSFSVANITDSPRLERTHRITQSKPNIKRCYRLSNSPCFQRFMHPNNLGSYVSDLLVKNDVYVEKSFQVLLLSICLILINHIYFCKKKREILW